MEAAGSMSVYRSKGFPSVLSRSSKLQARCFHFLSVSAPLLRKFKTQQAIPRKSSNGFLLFVRNCGPITAKPSSEIRKKSVDSKPDEKLRALREIFSRPGIGIDAYIIPSQDAHQSEFIAECFMRRAYISGFTGSAGTAIVTKDKAALWTDGRYFLQAEKQLSPNWILMRAGNFGVPTSGEWLNDVLAPGCRVGIDPFLFSSDAAEELKELISKKNHELVYIYDFNLVDEIWKESRPKPPKKPVRVHDIHYAGLDVPSKLSTLRSELIEAGSSAIVISMLDEVAWLLNLRGNDVPHSPVMYAYLIVEIDSAKLFIDSSKVNPEVMAHLQNSGVELRPYESILSGIESLGAKEVQLWLDTSSVNAAIFNTYRSAVDKYPGRIRNKSINKTRAIECSPCPSEEPHGVYKISPISLAKAIKNHAELEGMRNSHLRDAAALAQFWAWLEEEIHKNVVLTEVEVADRLFQFRANQAGFMDTSFDTISGSGANGAIIHYKPEPESCSVVDAEKLFLLDSGAQYIDGTTDITRTVHFGEPTSRQKECFTRVLQGHIALDQAVFPENTPGFVLDAFARSFLWKIGLDYRHGTGHGVGAGLNVHEGPQSISFRFGNMTPLQKGMVVSNEPGYYEDHSFGIRIENLLFVKEVETPNNFGGRGYLGFEKLTFVPIQSKLVNLALMSIAEVNWLNDYHSQVWDKVSPLLDGSTLKWLWNNTRPLNKQ
ncbi:aminopeptidase P2 [Telopea speciosissima]|uniref:aminopeptidase P2 n=1 Tax=Telopea speciosissima TaxID=54955 RepID=UPI001CC3B145|nr:aminopeptidase P2 [Telopea speciosissima]